MEDSTRPSLHAIEEWLLGPDDQTLDDCSHPSSVDSGGAQPQPILERCDLGCDHLGEMLPLTERDSAVRMSPVVSVEKSPVVSVEKSKGVFVFEAVGKDESMEKRMDLPVNVGPFCYKQHPCKFGVAVSLGTDCGEQRVGKDSCISFDTESSGLGECQQESGLADLFCGEESAKKGTSLILKVGSLGIEERPQELKKLEVVGDLGNDCVVDSKVSENQSDDETESESDVDSESSSSGEEALDGLSLSSDGGDDDILTVGKNVVCNSLIGDVVEEAEDGEIRNPGVEELILSSDDEDEGGTKGPIRSKNEMNDLPPVPPVNVVLGSHHQTLPVGVISSIIGCQVIIDGQVKHNPLNEGSILWVTETRSPLGLIEEIFGPVKNPYYIVRYNSASEIPLGIQKGTEISFVTEFSNVILNQSDLLKKGYDASGENDEELNDEIEFSDDEKEAEYRRSMKPAKRTENHRTSKQDALNRFKGKRYQKDVHHKPHPSGAFMGKPAPCTTMQSKLPSFSGSGDANSASNRLVQSRSGTTSMGTAVSQAEQPGGLIGAQQQHFLQQHPNAMWIPQVPIPQQNTGLPVSNQQNIRLPGGFGANTPFQHMQQLQQTPPQFLQQLFFPGLPVGFPFQQQLPFQGLFNLQSLNGHVNPSIGSMPMGISDFGQPQLAGSNVNSAFVVPSSNNTQVLGQSATGAFPGSLQPPMQFNMGPSNYSGGFPPSNAGGHPYRKRGNP